MVINLNRNNVSVKKISTRTTLIKILAANVFIQVQLRNTDRWTEKQLCRKDINMDLMEVRGYGVG